MLDIDFASYRYYPALRCSFPELHGYRQLSEGDKESVLPIFELGQRSFNDPDLDATIEQLREVVGSRPFILDVCKDPCPPPFVSKTKTHSPAELAKIKEQKLVQKSYNLALSHLLNPGNGFAVWRDLVATFPNCIPVLQYTDAGTEGRNILRQGAMLGRRGSIAIRITEGTDAAIHSTTASLIATLETSSSLLIVVDCGQGRMRIAERAEFARMTIANITSELDVAQRSDLQAVCISSSFPDAGHDNLKVYQSSDPNLFAQATETFPFIFGDYAANYRRRSTSTYMPGDWRATVASPSTDGWLIYRDPNARDQDGWSTGSKLIGAHPDFLSLDTWGATVIAGAANNKVTDENRSNRFYYAAKVNLHLHNQINIHRITDGDDDI